MKIAIVSTHKIECGIARFSEIVSKGLVESGHDVTIFELPPHELKASFGGTVEGANNFIEKVCEDLKSFDAVSVQCEYSLFADSMPVSVRRIKKILLANTNTTITLHTVINRSSSADAPFPSLVRWVGAPLRTVKAYVRAITVSMSAKTELNLFNFIKKNDIKVIVHTETTKSILQQRFRMKNVECHPLCYTSEKDKTEFAHELCRIELIDRLDLDTHAKLVGVFGFFGGYKGFDYAIKCISRLPEDYKLLIFSGYHPNSIRASDTSHGEQLMDLARKLKVLDRVYFMGSVDDMTLYRAVAGVDYSWLPYREVGQEASAICSEVAELSRRMLVSRNFAFLDYMRFGLREDYEFFEIGNIEELKLKTLMYDRFHPQTFEATVVKGHAERQAKFYIEVLLGQAA
jgi:glycosyltransferase involved in cell wall biosynthesis